jgi:hypothetical protein
MYPATAPAFGALRAAVESEWVPAMLGLLGLEAELLPAIWDIDFLRGPKTTAGDDSWALCEINASCVSPFPDEAPTAIARTVRARLAVPEASGRAGPSRT